MSEDNNINQTTTTNVEVETAPVTSVGTWLLTFVVIWIPIVGFIMSIVWMMSAKDKSRANYFKAALIMNVIIMVIALVLSCSISASVTTGAGTSASLAIQSMFI